MDFQFKVVHKTITLKQITDPISIYFWGDVHWDTKSCDKERWKYFLKRTRETQDENTYYVGMGDYHDFASTSEKQAIDNSKIHETTREKFDEIAEKDNRAFAMEIKHMRGKLLGLLHGNHSWNFISGKNSTEDLADRMEAEYLGWICYYHLTIQGEKGRHKCIDMVLCHGKAGGKLAGSSINQVEDLKRIFPLADIYCMGHDHNRGAWPVSVLYWDSFTMKIKQKRQFLCRSGTFKKGYAEDSAGYEIAKLFRPSDLGVIKLNLSIHRDRKMIDGKERDNLIVDIESVV